MIKNNSVVDYFAMFTLSVLISVLFVLFVDSKGELNPTLGWFCIAVYFVNMAFLTIRHTSIFKNIKVGLTAEFCFMVFFYLLFIKPYQDHLLGISRFDVVKFGINTFPFQANSAILLSTISVCAFSIGFLALERFVNLKPISINSTRDDYKYFDLLCLTCLILCVTPFWILDWGSSDISRYTGTESNASTNNGLYLFAVMFSMISLSRFVSIVAQKSKYNLYIILSVMLSSAWAFYIVSAGDRNNFLLICLAFLGGISAFVRKVSWPMIISLILLALTLYNTIEAVRVMTSPSIGDFYQALIAEKDNSIEGDSSFLITNATVRAAIYIVPDIEDYTYGIFKLVGVVSVVPYLGGFFFSDANYYTKSSEILSDYVITKNSSWKVGSNPISDLYLEFGVIGVIFGFLAIGAFVSYIKKKASNNGANSSTIIMYSVSFAMISELPRYSLDFPLKIIIWSLLLLFFYEKFFIRVFSNNSHK